MAADEYKQKVRKEPRISLNKLAEYLSTNKASRRERILLDQKYPPTFQTIRYDAARQIIAHLLTSGKCTTQEIQFNINELSAKKTTNDFDERMVKANVEALTYFMELIPSLAFIDWHLKLGPHAPAPLKLNGVNISVRPDLLVSTTNKAATTFGGIKFNIAKGSIHNKESSDYVGAIMLEYLSQNGGGATHSLCAAVDVFGKKVALAPKATSNRMKDAAAACAEIARVWSSL